MYSKASIQGIEELVSYIYLKLIAFPSQLPLLHTMAIPLIPSKHCTERLCSFLISSTCLQTPHSLNVDYEFIKC